MTTEEQQLVERLRAACVGHPHAKIAWPHRLLHEAAPWTFGGFASCTTSSFITTSARPASPFPGITPSEDEMSDLDPDLVRIGQSSDSMERRALALIGPIHNGYYRPGNPPTYGLPGVCERSTLPLPHGCWDHGNRSPYSMYGDDRWCNACIAYAALNGKLPRPEQQIEMTLAQRLVPA